MPTINTILAHVFTIFASIIPHHKQPKPKYHQVDSTCYADGGEVAASNGIQAHMGEVAMNRVPLWTRIELSRPVFGMRKFTVLDRIGSGSELDIFNPSEAACQFYGRERIGFRIIP